MLLLCLRPPPPGAPKQKAEGMDKNLIKDTNQEKIYLQTNSTSLTSKAHGMSILQDGEISEGHPHPDDWPYKTPLDAIRDS